MHAKIKDYIEIIEKVARVEHKRIPSHMVDYDELVSIGIIAIQVLIKDKKILWEKEVEGKITNDKTRETEGKLQKAKGKAKDKATDLKETLEDKKEG